MIATNWGVDRFSMPFVFTLKPDDQLSKILAPKKTDKRFRRFFPTVNNVLSILHPAFPNPISHFALERLGLIGEIGNNETT